VCHGQLKLFPETVEISRRLQAPNANPWALTAFLLVNKIGVGFALAATAELLYLPFSWRRLLLMGDLPFKGAVTI